MAGRRIFPLILSQKRILLNPDQMCRIQELRNIRYTRKLTLEESQEVVRMIRESRHTAAEAVGKVKKAPVDVQAVLAAFKLK
jgi:hypothetical protein